MVTRNLSDYRDKFPLFVLLFTTSFVSICIETAALYSFSIRIGYIYFHVSLLTSTLLLSASLGCAATHHYLKGSAGNPAKKLFLISELALIVLIALLFFRGSLLNSSLSYYILLTLTGAILGAQFSLIANSVVKSDAIKTDSGYVYAVDLLGAGLFLVVFIRFLPLIGLNGALATALFAKTISLLNLLLHFSRSSGKEGNAPVVTGMGENTATKIRLTAFHYIVPFIYGVSMIITQSLLIRMMLVNVGQSHISFGAPIGIWLLGAAGGSYTAGKSDLFKRNGLPHAVITIAASLLPASIFIFLYNAWEFKSVSFNVTFFIAVIFFASFVSGMIFPMLCHWFKDKAMVQITYVIEGIGAFAGGILFAFYNFAFSDFTLSVISALLIFSLVILLCVYNMRRYTSIVISVIALGYVAIFIFHDKLDTTWLQNQESVRNEKILFYKYTKNGRVEVIYENAKNNVAVYVDGVLQYSLADDLIHNQSMAVLSYYFTKTPVSALVVGGGVGGLARELLKFDLSRIDYIEIEPSFKEIRRIYFSQQIGDIAEDTRLTIINDDGFKFLREAKKKYDIIILDLPSPSTLQLSRFFTREFFKMAGDSLNPGGTFMLPLMDSITFPSEEYVNYSVHNTLKEEFDNLRVMLPFYYILKVANPKLASDYIKKPYFELVICSKDARISAIDENSFYDNVRVNSALRESPWSQKQYIDQLFKASGAYFEKVYAEYDFTGVSTLDRLLPLHLKWKLSKLEMNPNVEIAPDSSGVVTINEGQ